jgi:cellobiose phosphorylase
MARAATERIVGMRAFPNRYGHFEAGDGTFVVTDVLTPRPWINVLANENYGVVLSQAGGGFSWAGNCQIFRLNRWEQDLVRDDYGRFLYIQDLERPSEPWSTSFQPTRRTAELDEVRHSLGSTEFKRRFLELETVHTIFVPENDAAEVWLIEIRNLAARKRKLRLASYLEWHLGGIGEWHREFHRLFVESKPYDGCLLAWKHPGLAENRREITGGSQRAFVCWNDVDQVRWVTDKLSWLGPCGSLSDPRGLHLELEESKTPRWDDPVAAGLTEIEIGPNEARSLTIVIGAAQDAESCLAVGRSYGVSRATEELRRTRERWSERCAKGVRTESGSQTEEDMAIDLMIRTWLPYQAIAGRLYARCAYYQQGGAYGFRDQLQDSLMLLDSEPERTLTQLGYHAEAMYDDGAVRHWWHPGTDIYVDSHHSDTCLWLAYGLLEYLEATGDYSALDREYSYLDHETGKPGLNGTLWQHCLTGIDRALTRMSSRGLPLICSGDWNDGLSHVGIDGSGESTWLAMFMFDILRRWKPHLEKVGLADVQNRFNSKCHELASAVNRFCWDGEWYTAGTRDDGEPIGSASCSQGRIFLNPQTWAVISGIAPSDRIAKAMNSVKKHLVTPYGALLLRPAYSQVDPYVGYISRYAPGLRENGGVYSHASTWAIQAFAMIGQKETARAIYLGMLPPLRAAMDPDLYAAEPYVMPGNVDGPDSPYAGRAGWTWYTGSAAWMRRVSKWIR